MKRWLVRLMVGGLVAACASAPHTLSGVADDPPRAAQDFTLTDGAGQAFSLSDLDGRWILLAYGYTSCPDVCPLTLAHLRAVKVRLGDDAERAAVVFVSIDPERDTPDIVGRYVKHFGEDFIGLTGTPEQVAAAAAAFGARYEKIESDSAAGYSMSHTAFVYLIDPQFRLRLTFPFGVTADEIASDLQYLMTTEGRTN